ncbi:RNA-binding protein [Agrobacterium vitis]|uniref:RNA-binding protein n=1 Tax=Agrobacterium vitis TaxID=373 RepID=A0ABD6GFD4_AGRVI|nr:RNA-binding protein [Agrobacterium vitis]MUO79705.1 RNA-binding protein [Agrobacterium vitis]MUO96857.1 RNA-binding protein [Agrobacterium vitis]MUP07682.1 RNA-binding protein [Agrobacterium vitis]MUZ83634.1 RNA-binding protein [Agrobacterium vitis]MVA11875.1 RNA-binding protein [Agrobacterium vitis]
MVNKAIFKTYLGKLLPFAETTNHEGAPAYRLTPREALAQYAVTGTFNGTFYADGAEQLEAVKTLALQVEPEFLAKVAIHAAESGHMKDMPVTLLAVLSGLQSEAFARAFPRVVRSGKMLRGFVQVMRSGATGRKSLGTRPKKLVQAWLERASTEQILRAMVGNDPSLADVIRMVHPKPASEEKKALYAWVIGKPHDYAALPELVKALHAFRQDQTLPIPDVPFQMLTSLPLTREHWVEIAEKGSWQMVRQNLNTFARKGVFEVEGVAMMLAARLADPDEIRNAKVFPYQLMMTWKMVGGQVPDVVHDALQDAMDIAIANVPSLPGNVVLCPDVSGSMGSPVTGYRKGATSAVRCIDVAGLMTAAFLRRNPKARVLPFEKDVVDVKLNRQDSVMTNAGKLAAVGGGGTNCSAPLRKLADDKAKVDLVVFISDNQSWVDARGSGQPTAVMTEWARIKRVNPAAKLVCLDIQPHATSQAPTRDDVLNIGGFSDAVYGVISEFAANKRADGWVKTIEAIEL